MRTAIITAILTFRADLDATEACRQHELDENHAPFAREFDAWMIRDDNCAPKMETDAAITMEIPDDANILLYLTYGEACLHYGYVNGCDGRSVQGDSGHGGGSSLYIL